MKSLSAKILLSIKLGLISSFLIAGGLTWAAPPNRWAPPGESDLICTVTSDGPDRDRSRSPQRGARGAGDRVCFPRGLAEVRDYRTVVITTDTGSDRRRKLIETDFFNPNHTIVDLCFLRGAGGPRREAGIAYNESGTWYTLNFTGHYEPHCDLYIYDRYNYSGEIFVPLKHDPGEQPTNAIGPLCGALSVTPVAKADQIPCDSKDFYGPKTPLNFLNQPLEISPGINRFDVSPGNIVRKLPPSEPLSPLREKWASEYGRAVPGATRMELCNAHSSGQISVSLGYAPEDEWATLGGILLQPNSCREIYLNNDPDHDRLSAMLAGYRGNVYVHAKNLQTGDEWGQGNDALCAFPYAITSYVLRDSASGNCGPGATKIRFMHEPYFVERGLSNKITFMPAVE